MIFGSFDTSSIPIGIVAPSKSEPRPTCSTPAIFATCSMCSTIFSQLTIGSRPVRIASWFIRPRSLRLQASSTPHSFEIASAWARCSGLRDASRNSWLRNPAE